MKTLALFNNKGGVGKTTLTYHLAHMLQRIGYRVLAVDLDPQANLTSSFLDDQDLAELWGEPEDALSGVAYPRRLPGTGVTSGDTGTVAAAIEPLLDQTGDVRFFEPVQILPGLNLVPGDLELSRFEDKLSDAWPRCFVGSDKGALRVSTAFYRIIQEAGEQAEADIALIDVGPNLGAINRSALLAADCVLMPLAADLYSLRGLRNLGPSLRDWRHAWQGTVVPKAPKEMQLPPGTMEPIGYVIMQPVMRLSRPARAYEPWLKRIPEVYATSVLGKPFDAKRSSDYHIATMPNYQSLMPLAHDARKPMFDLRGADGALGATQAYVDKCFQDFRRLAKAVAQRLNL